MKPLMRALAPDFDVHAIDLPGFGSSSRPRRTLNERELAGVVRAWMTEARIDKPVVLGHSFGAQVVVEVAVADDGAARAVVLVGATVDRCARGAARQLWRLMKDVPREPPALPFVLAEAYLRSVTRLAGTFRAARRHAMEDSLPHVTVPALVVRGSRDPLVPSQWAEEMTRLLPAGRLCTIPGGAHAVNYSHPREVAAAIRTFTRPLRP